MRWLSFFILCGIGLVLQTTVAHRLQINHVSMDLMFIIALHYALHAPLGDAKLAAWTLGFCTDLVGPGRLGVMGLCYGLTALVVVQFRDTMFRSHPLTSLFVTLICTWLVQLAAGWFFVLMSPNIHRGTLDVLPHATYTAIYTAALAPSLHWFLDRLRSPLGLTPPPRLRMRRSG